MSYLLTILKHKWFVFVAGRRIGGIPLWRLIIHDWSKFTPSEFFPYRKRYTLDNCLGDEWDQAWLHHIHHNPHHWQHWILNDRVLYMPEVYVREMVADFLAASRSYNGSWDIQPWINTELHRIRLHPTSFVCMSKIIHDQMFVLPKMTAENTVDQLAPHKNGHPSKVTIF